MIRRPCLSLATYGSLVFMLLVLATHAHGQKPNAPAPGGDPVRGEQIALSCSRCHGDKGVSNSAWIPSLAGMNAQAIYKQLDDYRAHRRRPDWYMASIAEALSRQESADVATYYAVQASVFRSRAKHADSLRGIASCETCHNGRRGDAPQIVGQQTQYLEIQLSLFAQGIRTNDRDQVMQKLAGQLTVDQIRQLSESLGVQSH